MNKLLSYALATLVGLLIVAPPINYSIPLMVNSFHWCYLVIVSGLFGMFLLAMNLHRAIKCLVVYLFVSCFFSQAPYLSFNAFILVVATLYVFLGFKKADYEIILNMVQAAFWLEFVVTIMQLLGKDTLLNFDRPEKVFLGTVMQYMRFSSVLAVMAPLLILKSKWYLLPVSLLCVISQSSSFALSLIAGGVVYNILQVKRYKAQMIFGGIICALAYVFYDFGSWGGAINPAHGGRLSSWWAILVTWFTDTSKATIPPFLYGPFRLDWFLFGHGMDTFLPLFPIYKHDMNPFPQAHNSYLQFLWEIGVVGTGLLMAYLWNIFKNVKQPVVLSGAVMIAVNSFFAFPDRMTQTILLIVLFISICEKATKGDLL